MAEPESKKNILSQALDAFTDKDEKAALAAMQQQVLAAQEAAKKAAQELATLKMSGGLASAQVAAANKRAADAEVQVKKLQEQMDAMLRQKSLDEAKAKIDAALKARQEAAKPQFIAEHKIKADETSKTTDKVSAFNIIEDYLNAIGGKEEVKKVKSISANISMEMMGRTFTGTDKLMSPNKHVTEIKMENVAIMIEENPPAHATVGEDPGQDLLGLYNGIMKKDRGFGYGNVLPDQIIIYRKPLERMSSSLDDLRENVRQTVIHEIGHYFGFDEEELQRLEEENF